MVKPYFPDIIQNIVSRVNDSFIDRDEDPFEVFFDKGLIQQVKRSVADRAMTGPLIWLVYKYAERFGNPTLYSENDFQIVITYPTDNKYTQQQREDISYKPRLIPAAMQFIYEMTREYWFDMDITGPKYQQLMAPYWNMGEPGGQDAAGMFGGEPVDAIFLTFTGLRIQNHDCAYDGTYPVPDTTGYPVSNARLMFYDDLELIVDGGQPTDPVSGQSNVIIPFLIGKYFTVEKRGLGQLRTLRLIEIIRDEVNGGFAFADEETFASGATYIVKIRPQYIN